MKKLFLIFALLPAFAFAQNAVVSVMPGYSFASKMQGPALSVNYSQAWKGKSGYSQHWTWQVGLASYNGAEKKVDFEPFQDQAFCDMLSVGVGFQQLLGERWKAEADVFTGFIYHHSAKQGATSYFSAELGSLFLGANLRIGYRIGEHFGLGLYSTCLMPSSNFPFGRPMGTAGIDFYWSL
jgi:hypothetical protein